MMELNYVNRRLPFYTHYFSNNTSVIEILKILDFSTLIYFHAVGKGFLSFKWKTLMNVIIDWQFSQHCLASVKKTV